MSETTRTVLLVEDNPMTRKMFRIALESDGYTVIEAPDGRAALTAAARAMPALVLQDLILPDMNGFELVRQLRAFPGGDVVPILALSGFLSRIEEARTAQAGFTALLVKPVEPSRLLDTIRPYFPVQADAAARPGAGRKVLLVDADPVQLKVVQLHLEHVGFDVATARSSGEAMRQVRERIPDVVFADVLMPGLDGFQLCYELRSDAKFSRVPVVLSAWYQTAEDVEFAHRVGASALVLRSPQLTGMVDALLLAVKQGPPAAVRALDGEVQLDHAKAVIRQLERQLALSTDLARRCTLQAAQISLLGGVADALSRKTDVDVALRDVLAATLDAAGISKGALFLRNSRGALQVRHAIGFSATEREGLADFFGHLPVLEDSVARQATVSVPSPALSEEAARTILARADVASAQIVPLVSDTAGVGAMVLAAKRTDVTNEDSIAFARAMGNQLAQSMELASSFARLLASEQRYRTVTESANDAISILTPDGVIVEVNRSFAVSLGIDRDKVIGHQIRDFAAPGHEQNGIATKSLAGDGTTTPVPLRRADGTLLLMEFSNRAVEVGGEKLVFSIGRDVTERVQAQAQLMVSDRMASVGILAAGVAHEINNPLAAAAANLEFATKEVADFAQRTGTLELKEPIEALRDAREAADRVRTIVRDLKIFSRPEEERRSLVDVRRVLDSSLRMAWNEIRHRAQLVKDYDKVAPVEANESRLGQVFLNLIVNAAQAIGEGHANMNQIRLRARNESARVLVDIEDTGTGIPPEVMSRLFTPFFTTKPPGVGTGLGLSICHRIVTGLGGQITVDSKVGRGTLFRILLPPATVDGAWEEITRPRLRTIASRRGRILVLDDEPMVGRAVRRVLELEHEVVVMTSAKEGLERISRGERFDVVVCDLMMPVMSGAEFHAALSVCSPEHAERMVFLTGGAFTSTAREFLDRVPNPRLEKPFEAQTLRSLVGDFLR